MMLVQWGGVVSLRTREPEDVLLTGRKIGTQVISGYDGRYNGKFITVAGAAKSNQGSVLIQYTKRRSHEAKFDSIRTETVLDQEGNWDTFLNDLADFGYDVDNMTQQELDDEYEFFYGKAPKYDTYKTVTKDIADKFTVNTYSFLNKWNWDINPDHRLSFSLDRFHSNNIQATENTLDVLQNKQITDDDNTYMSRLTLGLQGRHNWQTFATDRINWRISHMKTEQIHTNMRYEQSLGYSNYARISANNSYDTKTKQVQLNAVKYFTVGLINNSLDYGVSYRNSELSNLLTNSRELFMNNTATNSSNVSSYFPYSKRIEKAIFLSNRLQYANIPVTLTPSIKYTKLNEHSYMGSDYSLTTGSNGDVYFSDQVRKFHTWDYSLTLGWQLNTANYLSLAYSQAHRFPSYSEMSPSTYYHAPTQPNPNLRPEKSNGISFGWALKSGWYKQSIELAYTRVSDKLETKGQNCTGPSNCGSRMLTNLSDPVSIKSIEYTGEIDFGEITPWLEGLNLVTVLAYAKGKDKSINKPLNSIAPLNGHTTLAYKKAYVNTFARVNYSKAKKEKDIGQYDNAFGGTPPAMPGWATLDLGLGFSFKQQANINFVVYNVFDKQYQRWENVNYENVAFRDQLWEPGRAFGMTLDIKF